MQREEDGEELEAVVEEEKEQKVEERRSQWEATTSERLSETSGSRRGTMKSNGAAVSLSRKGQRSCLLALFVTDTLMSRFKVVNKMPREPSKMCHHKMIV